MGGAGLLTSAPSTSNMQMCTIVCRSSTASHSSVTVLPLSLKLPYNRERDWRLVQSLPHKEQARGCSRPLCLSFCRGKMKEQIDSVHNLICCHVSPHWSCPLLAEAFPALLSRTYHPIACISNLLRRYSRDHQDLQSKGYVTEEGSQLCSSVWGHTSFGLWTPPGKHPISGSQFGSHKSIREAFFFSSATSFPYISCPAVSWQHNVFWGTRQHHRNLEQSGRHLNSCAYVLFWTKGE